MKTRVVALIAISVMFVGRTTRAQNLQVNLSTNPSLAELLNPVLPSATAAAAGPGRLAVPAVEDDATGTRAGKPATLAVAAVPMPADAVKIHTGLVPPPPAPVSSRAEKAARMRAAKAAPAKAAVSRAAKTRVAKADLSKIERETPVAQPAVAAKADEVRTVAPTVEAHADATLTLAKAARPTGVVASLCDIKAHPEKYLHKSVQFSAVVSRGFEDSMVEDANCKWNVKDAPGVWMEYGGTTRTGVVFCCDAHATDARTEDLTLDGIRMPLEEDARFERLQGRLREQVTGGTALVRATVRGYILARPQTLFGETAYKGYGHMGCCMLFVLTDVVSVDPKPVDTALYGHGRPQAAVAAVTRTASLTLKADGR